MLGHLCSLVPGERAAQPCGKVVQGRDQPVADRLGVVLTVEMDQVREAGRAVYNGADGGATEAADDEIAFPVASDLSRLGLMRTIVDRPHRLNKPLAPLGGLAVRLAAGAAGSCRDGAVSPKAIGVGVVDGGVDRLGAGTHRGVGRVVLGHAAADLFRGPALLDPPWV